MTDREKFEAFALLQGIHQVSRRRDGKYWSSHADIAWNVWQESRRQALQEAYDAMFDVKGDKATRFDAQTAIRKLGEEAA